MQSRGSTRTIGPAGYNFPVFPICTCRGYDNARQSIVARFSLLRSELRDDTCSCLLRFLGGGGGGGGGGGVVHPQQCKTTTRGRKKRLAL